MSKFTLGYGNKILEEGELINVEDSWNAVRLEEQELLLEIKTDRGTVVCGMTQTVCLDNGTCCKAYKLKVGDKLCHSLEVREIKKKGVGPVIHLQGPLTIEVNGVKLKI